MKKLKYLLILSLIAILAGGIFTACEKVGSVDSTITPIRVTYCANGGEIGGKAERYLYLEEGVKIPQPGDGNSLIEDVYREGYKFLGWVEGKTGELLSDSEGRLGTHYLPKLLSVEDGLEWQNTYGAKEGGVYMNIDGALTAEEKKDIDESENISAAYKDITLRMYDYDRPEDDVYFDFNVRTTASKPDVVLIAVWADYNKFIVADCDKTQDGTITWKQDEIDELEELANVIATDTKWAESDLYKKYESRLFDVTAGNGTRIRGRSEVMNAYNATRNSAYYKALVARDEAQAALDAEVTPGDAQDKLKKALDDANAELAKQKIEHSAIRFYSSQNFAESDLTYDFPYEIGDQKVTILYFTEVDGDFDIAFTYDDFAASYNTNRNIYVDENLTKVFTSGASDLTARYSGTIMGNNHTISVSGMTINQVQKGKLDENNSNLNTYGVLFGDIGGATIENLTFELEATFVIDVDPVQSTGEWDEENKQEKTEFVDNDAKCLLGALANSVNNSKLTNIIVNLECKVERTMVDDLDHPIGDTGEFEQIPNTYDVTVKCENLYGKGTGNTESGVFCNVQLVTDEVAEG